MRDSLGSSSSTMADIRTVIQRIVTAAPSLQPWAARYLALGYLDDFWLQFTHELIQHVSDGTIPELRAIAPIIEEALEQEVNDEVSLSFIETLISNTEEQRFDTRRLRAELGPAARQTWDDLYQYLHQSDWALVHFRHRDIDNFPAPSARFERWVMAPGTHLDAQQPLARIVSEGRGYELRTNIPCRVNRFAVKEGQEILEDDLLLYILPDDYREFRRPEPYITLHALEA